MSAFGFGNLDAWKPFQRSICRWGKKCDSKSGNSKRRRSRSNTLHKDRL